MTQERGSESGYSLLPIAGRPRLVPASDTWNLRHPIVAQSPGGGGGGGYGRLQHGRIFSAGAGGDKGWRLEPFWRLAVPEMSCGLWNLSWCRLAEATGQRFPWTSAITGRKAAKGKRFWRLSGNNSWTRLRAVRAQLGRPTIWIGTHTKDHPISASAISVPKVKHIFSARICEQISLWQFERKTETSRSSRQTFKTSRKPCKVPKLWSYCGASELRHSLQLSVEGLKLGFHAEHRRQKEAICS